jgi:GDPmannose 4,6-dehydratase
LNRFRIDHIKSKNFKLFYGDLTDSSSLIKILSKTRPDEIYNLAAQSHVLVSFTTPEYTSDTNALGLVRLLESVKSLKLKSRIYQAATSEMYGNINSNKSINMKTPFSPVSPYGAAKLYAYHLSEIYKKAYDMYICNGILFNHESKRRGENFITQKIILFAKQYKDSKKGFLKVGNLNSKRDWGDAEDYVYAMWLMLQQNKPRNYIVATNKSITVKKFIELVFNKIQVKIKWAGKGLSEVGVDRETNKVLIKVDKKYFRPIDVNFLKGDYTETLMSIGWKPKTSLDQLINKMLKD